MSLELYKYDYESKSETLEKYIDFQGNEDERAGFLYAGEIYRNHIDSDLPSLNDDVEKIRNGEISFFNMMIPVDVIVKYATSFGDPRKYSMNFENIVLHLVFNSTDFLRGMMTYYIRFNLTPIFGTIIAYPSMKRCRAEMKLRPL